MRILPCLLVTVVAVATPAAASAVTVSGGVTAFRPLDILLARQVAPIAPVTLDRSIFEIPKLILPISGGSIDAATVRGTILHAGTSFYLGGGAQMLQFDDLVVDTIAGTISGGLRRNNMPIAAGQTLFTFSLAGRTPQQIRNTLNPGINLFFTPYAAGIFAETYDVTAPTTRVALLATNPSIVPEPATWAMLILGFGAVGAAMRRRRVAEPA